MPEDTPTPDPAGRPASLTHTSWTLVERVRMGGNESAPALESLCSFLYRPVHAAVRAMMENDHDAEDITQKFFVDVLLWRDLIVRADPAKGRLRTLVREAARNFVRDAGRRARVRQVVNGTVRLDDDRVAELPDDAGSAAFEDAWFDTLCIEACRRCEDHFRRAGLAGHWTLFERARLLPATRRVQRPESLSEVMHEHGFSTQNQARSAVDTVAKRLRVLIAHVACEMSVGEEDRLEQLAALRRRGITV